jgi:hypothetical protein
MEGYWRTNSLQLARGGNVLKRFVYRLGIQEIPAKLFSIDESGLPMNKLLCKESRWSKGKKMQRICKDNHTECGENVTAQRGRECREFVKITIQNVERT